MFMPACSPASTPDTNAETTSTLQAASTQTNTPTAIPATKTPTPVEGDTIVLQFWHPWTGNKAQVISELVAEFNQTNEAGISVVAKSVADEDYLIEVISEAVETGEVPDIIAAPSNFLRSFYAEQRLLISMDNFITDEEQGISEEDQKSIPTQFWNLDVLDGERYAVPAEYDLHLLFYNQTWAQELGFENAPTTSEDFLNQACTAARQNAYDTDDDNNGTGGWIYNTEPATMLSWMRVFGGGDIPSDLLQGFQINTDEDQEAMEYLQSIYQLDCAWTGKETTPYSYFSKRYALFYSGTIEDWTQQLTMDTIEGNSDDWTVIPYPGQDGSPIVLSDNLSYAIFQSTAEDENAAWMFIRWMLTDEVQITLAERTYSVPFNLSVVQELGNFIEENPTWQKVVQYVPLARTQPVNEYWNVLGSLLQDMGWQLSQYNITAADIPPMLESMENMVDEVVYENQ